MNFHLFLFKCQKYVMKFSFQSTEGECDYGRRMSMAHEAGAKFRRSRTSTRSVLSQVTLSLSICSNKQFFCFFAQR